MFYIFFIEVDLWLILFLKGENTGGMGCVPITGLFYYSCLLELVLSAEHSTRPTVLGNCCHCGQSHTENKHVDCDWSI